MPDITVSTPNIGFESFVSFKEPVSYYVKNKFNLNASSMKLKVISVISMKDTIRNDLRDPYTDLYLPAGISELEYKKDLIDNVPVVSFSFRDMRGVERFIRSPLNYIESFSSVTNVEYQNKLLVLDLGYLPSSLDTTVHFEDIKDFIESHFGVEPSIKEVSVGNTESLDNETHELRETVRNNSITVHKTAHIQLAEMQLKHNQLLQRLNELGIVLG